MKLPPWRDYDYPLFDIEAEVEGHKRAFSVWRWDERLVFQDAACQLWWATRILPEGVSAPKFWHGEVEARRVFRVFTAERGFAPAPRSNGAYLTLQPGEFDVLVRADNSGLARGALKAQWLPFAARAPRRPVARPLAHKPSILSPRFKVSPARRALSGIGDELARQKLDLLPPLMRAAWDEGAAHRPLLLVRAALGLGLAPQSRAPLSLEVFWRLTLGKAASQTEVHLPLAMIQSEELQVGGEVSLRGGRLSHSEPGVWKRREGDVSLAVRLPSAFDSHHERLEARLELRDFLTRFFPASQVEEWLA